MPRPDLMRLSKGLGRLFMRLSGISWRIRYLRPSSGRSGMNRTGPVFFAFWHGRQLPLIHTHRFEGITVLVSQNVDGQYVTNVLHAMGFGTIRGSSSRGGMEALRRMSDLLRNGTDCAITPDGPRGPDCKPKAGTAHISRLGRRPLVPMGTSAWPAVRFSSWDRFLLPLPFARVTVVEGRPLRPMQRNDDTDSYLSMIESRLNSVTATADLFSSPAAGIQSAVLRAVANLLRPFISIGLLFRTGQERSERKGFAERRFDRPVWLHGSSLGELNGLMPYVRELRNRNVPCHVTCFTPAGMTFIKDKGLRGSYMPLDVPGYVDAFLARIDPRAFILSETEVWPNTIMEVMRRGIPSIMINAKLSQKIGYAILAPLLGRLLSCFSAVITRSSQDMERFLDIGVDPRVMESGGDSKLLADCGDPPAEWRHLLSTGLPVLVAGSTRDGEEEVILEACREAGYFPVIVPRHLERVRKIERLMGRMGYSPVLWSSLAADSGIRDFDSVIIDVHGVLAKMYGVGDFAFVGGTIAEIGGHNVLEPILRGVPFAVGPHHGNFRDTVSDLVSVGAAFIFRDSGELSAVLKEHSCRGGDTGVMERCFRDVREKLVRDVRRSLNLLGILTFKKVKSTVDHGEHGKT